LTKIKGGSWPLQRNNSDRAAFTALLVLIVVFVFGVLKLFIMRFEAGDVYPAYSSLRADPLGVKALYEGLDGLRGVSASRNYRFPARHGDWRADTVLFFGVHSSLLDRMDEKSFESLERFVERGGRLVVTLYPEGRGQARGQGGDAEKVKSEVEGSRDFVSLSERWGFVMAAMEMPEGTGSGPLSAVLVSDRHGFPDSLSWHSMLYFQDPDASWDGIYAAYGLPVIIERKLGKGTVVLSADSYFVSNEAMLRERHPGLLAWLVGKGRTVAFDETHLGIQENPGISALGRKYRLHGLFAGVVLLALLFVWKNSSGLVPLHEGGPAAGREGAASGRDYASGVVSLLCRNIAEGRILEVCLEEWKKAALRKDEKSAEKAERMGLVLESEMKLPARQRNLPRAYRSMSEILSEGKRI
jgi:hypothetical protein